MPSAPARGRGKNTALTSSTTVSLHPHLTFRFVGLKACAEYRGRTEIRRRVVNQDRTTLDHDQENRIQEAFPASPDNVGEPISVVKMTRNGIECVELGAYGEERTRALDDLVASQQRSDRLALRVGWRLRITSADEQILLRSQR